MEELTSEQAAKVERLVNLGLTREQAVAIATERQPDEAVASPGKHAPRSSTSSRSATRRLRGS